MQVQKRSKKREAILSCLRSTTSHPTADWVYSRLKPEIPNLSMGTVYRNLAMFKRAGVISMVGVVNGMERFDANITPHVHFVCTHCDAVIDVEDMEVPTHLASALTCGCASDCSLIFHGVCNTCIDSDAVQYKNLGGNVV
ncbi:MAG: transcriptional repressor [Oscillospiraceae bacterium]|jgi:Fur family peroxide stress response transcriptional regulator|nr:transcriptional repressor [Oscillospiraceae bacterium]